MIAKHRADDLAISPLVKLECLVGPSKANDSAARKLFLEFFQQFSQLDIPEPAYLRASEIRARYGLKTPDALHLSCAQHHGCGALWTNDARLDKASSDLARNIFA
ncbi:MAG: type II toxin-antitoxin system VapC family toxin [Rhizomicrobium sp.]